MQKINRRTAAKYPALRRDLNTKTRHYYIEPEYINGVVNAEGEQVIRPLTDKEKTWLNKFYEEYIVTSFKKTHRDLHNKQKQRRELYVDNNRRNRCIYNAKQRTGDLINFSTENYDRMQYETINHVDFEMVYINEIEMRDIATIILELAETCGPVKVYNIVKEDYPEYITKIFSESELKKMKPMEIGITLIEEAKMLLDKVHIE